MLYIVVIEESGAASERTWHVGEPAPLLITDNVVEVQADEDELEYIYQHFPNLPQASKRVVRWFGDMARFIALNLK